MNIVKRLFLIALLLAAAGSQARDGDPTDPFHGWKGENETGQFSYDDSHDRPWQESDTELLKLPPDDDLLPVRADSLPANLQAHIAAGSLSFDPKDRVLRYWLVITAPGGGYNATFEGMRCEAHEYKIYAYGNPRRTPPVQPAPTPAWKRLSDNWHSDYRAELQRTLLCGEAFRPRPVADILATLRGQRGYRDPTADNTDF